MLNKLFSHTGILEKSLDASWLRNEVISHNIANVDTPGYKKFDVKFEDELHSAIHGKGIKGRKTRDKHIDLGAVPQVKVEPSIVESGNTKMRFDENNVDMDVEMSNLAKNTIMYNALTQKLSREFQKIKNVINEGRR